MSLTFNSTTKQRLPQIVRRMPMGGIDLQLDGVDDYAFAQVQTQPQSDR